MAGIESPDSIEVPSFADPRRLLPALWSPVSPDQFDHALPRLSDSRFDACRGWLRAISAGQPAQVTRAAPC